MATTTLTLNLRADAARGYTRSNASSGGEIYLGLCRKARVLIPRGAGVYVYSDGWRSATPHVYVDGGWRPAVAHRWTSGGWSRLEAQ